MVIEDCYDLHRIIVELEVALQIDAIDYDEKNLDIFIKNVKMRIGRQYQVDLVSYQIGSAELSMEPYRSNMLILLDNIASIHGKLCGCCQMMRYNTQTPISLFEINYLGFTKDSLKLALKKMQKKRTQPSIEEALNAFKSKLMNVGLCWEKRLFVLAIITYELGFTEVTAAIGEILYLGLIE